MKELSLIQLFEKHVRGTESQCIVVNKTINLCSLTLVVAKVCELSSQKVYINTRVIKHCYDKRPAEEFDSILKYASQIVESPDHIYKNGKSKRGEIFFTKQINGVTYFCSLEFKEGQEEINIVTIFRLREEKRERYLKKYRLMWSWKGGESSS